MLNLTFEKGLSDIFSWGNENTSILSSKNTQIKLIRVLVQF